MTKKYKEKAALRPPFRLASLPRVSIPKNIGIIIAALCLVVAWQLVYPRDRALPFARLDGSFVSGKSAADIERLVGEEYKSVTIGVQVGDKTYDSDASSVGIVPDVTATSSTLTEYPLWQRLVPFSMTLRGLLTNQSVVTTLDATTFSDYARTLAEQCAVPITPARLSLSSGQILVQKAQDGQQCSDDAISKAFTGLGLQKSGVAVVIKPQVLEAPGKSADTTEIISKAEQLTEQSITLSIDATKTAIPKEAIVSWLTLPYDDKTQQYDIAIDAAAIKAYVRDAESAVYIEPGVTRIHNDKDGIEQGREAGAIGRGLDIVPIANELATAVLGGVGGTVEAASITLQPTIRYDHSYTPDHKGLQKLLDDLVKNKGDFGIALHTTDGNLRVSSNGDRRYPPASTYKMIVGWAILKRIDAGQMSWDDRAVLGLTVSECFDTMIINSNNECAEYFGEKVIGWRNLNTMAQGLGMSCSDWNAGWYSCAKDEALFLQKLDAGELLDAAQTERLLSVMRVQVFRQGIPAGVNWTVEDKVGFLYGLLHDAALVSSPYGEYALVILTDNSSWAEIADAAWQIDAQFTRMNQ